MGACARSFASGSTGETEGLDTCIAFNISALSLQHLDFPDLVERMCRALGVPTDRLVLELTEGATQPLIKLIDTLTRFRIKGIGLAIDDFGTGYSSLMQLRQLPFTEVKIDQAFVADARAFARLPADRSVDRGPCPWPRADRHRRGVETIEQLRTIRELGCDVAQGYLIAQPMASDASDGLEAGFPRALAGDDRGREARPVGGREVSPNAANSSRARRHRRDAGIDRFILLAEAQPHEVPRRSCSANADRGITATPARSTALVANSSSLMRMPGSARSTHMK